MKSLTLKTVTAIGVLSGIAAGAYLTREMWLPSAKKPGEAKAAEEGAAPTGKVILTDQAIANLKLTAQPLKAGPYWKTITVPGAVVDRPGLSDRGLVAPVTGVVNAIYHFPGETVGPGTKLFAMTIMSETFHTTQSELFKATQDIKLAEKERIRIAPLAGEGIKASDLIAIENQIARLQVALKAYRQDLENRGLTVPQIDLIAQGRYLKEIDVSIPIRPEGSAADPAPALEIQELKVELGHLVQAGQTLCLLANHRRLAIEGRAFPDETPFLERSVKEGWPIEVDFMEPTNSGWDKRDSEFHITHLSNTIDAQTRTFAFLMPLDNESRTVERSERNQLLWRYRPGQVVRLQVKIEKLDNVFVLPADAIARDGPEAFVFTQNVSTFERKPVQVLLETRERVVIANDGALPSYKRGNEVWTIAAVAQSAAAQLNRMTKASTSSVPKGYHVHADGSVHKNGDED